MDTILRRLFWEEKVLRFEPQTPRFACTCSRERVANMMRSLGLQEAQEIVAERGEIDVGCDFCGQQYRFDAVDAAELFAPVATSRTPRRLCSSRERLAPAAAGGARSRRRRSARTPNASV